MNTKKVEYTLCDELIAKGLICPHDLYWTLYYIIKSEIKEVAYYHGSESKQDIVIAFRGCEAPSWEHVYLKTIDGNPFRTGWENKPNYSLCFCNSCKLASQHGFNAKWKKSNKLLDKIVWFLRKGARCK